jgi:hypothetical protein
MCNRKQKPLSRSIKSKKEEKLNMSTSLLLEAKTKLEADPEGAYKTQLIALVEKYRDEFALVRQGFLPPDEYDVAVHMESAVETALAIIRDYEPTAKQGDAIPAGAGVIDGTLDI